MPPAETEAVSLEDSGGDTTAAKTPDPVVRQFGAKACEANLMMRCALRRQTSVRRKMIKSGLLPTLPAAGHFSIQFHGEQHAQ
jgi:hypothetical protein